ncbi:Reverse transcriptase domain-containing protein [Aphis craccivora]|uniref:Reverse transcriptase domain-containing protein n=1 Tax=Aphis craccivora TaxID=307492 RepID=A0A6G0YFD4_APHCR|nr:Reverse transcriptase domain-containing protein [Aphis craccivora]
MFADETTILTQDSSLDLAIQNLQISLNEITTWFQKWKLNLNPTKSEVKIFTLKRYNNPKDIHINNQVIQ